MSEPGELQSQLTAAHDLVRQRDLLVTQMVELQRQHADIEAEVTSRADAAQLEQADVDKLTSFSGAKVWAVIKGTRDIDMSREQTELEAARGLLAEVTARRARQWASIESVRRRLTDLGDVEAQLEQAVAAKQRHLISTQSAPARELLALAEEQGRLTAELRQLGEAVEAGRRAGLALAALQSELGTASGWSTYDTFFGGGLIATSMKHSHMDRAAELARDADAQLADFGSELADVTGERGTGGSLEMDGGLRFMDMWFDNVFTDFSVRARIEEAQHKAGRARGGVDQGLHQCERRRADVQSRLAAISLQRQSLISGS